MAVTWTLVSPWTADVSPEEVSQELAMLDLDDACEVYRIRHRSVFKTSLPPLGEVAIKEVRHLRAKQRFKLRHGGSSKAEQEFRNAQALYRKGLRTPTPYAIGLDHHWYGLERVFQIYEWLPAAETLTDCLRRGDFPWQEVSDFLWMCAQAGLVHWGHSSENLLRCEGQWYVVDLADAEIGEHYEREGFIRDAARIACRLRRENVLGERQLQSFIDNLAECANDTSFQTDIPRAMKRLLEKSPS